MLTQSTKKVEEVHPKFETFLPIHKVKVHRQDTIKTIKTKKQPYPRIDFVSFIFNVF